MPRRPPSPAAALPAVDRLLREAPVAGLARPLALRAVREVLDEARRAVREEGAAVPPMEVLVARVVTRVGAEETPAVRRVLNATGVVLHTNLGRAPLAPAAVEAVVEAARGYGTLEVDLATGQRGERLVRVAALLRELTGAEDALVVNNNAAAVLLALTALARDRAVVVSRGELVEIGGSFRIPDVAAAGGARLVEVGTTNRTRLGDYAAALAGDVAGILKVHPSNFRIVGFTERPERADLARLAQDRGVWLVEDLGSGNLVEGVPGEPTVREVLAAGVDLVTFSGDKLLGGPQAGVVAGRRDLVQRLRRHPLYRALRVDKLVMAALDATLRLHRAGETVPALAMLGAGRVHLEERAERIVAGLGSRGVEASCQPVEGRAGAGALPEHPLPSVAVALGGLPAERLALALRRGVPPVLGRVVQDVLLLDPRTLLPGEDEELVDAVVRAAAGLERE